MKMDKRNIQELWNSFKRYTEYLTVVPLMEKKDKTKQEKYFK